MSYKGFKNQRAFHNNKIHALASMIVPSDMLDEFKKDKVKKILEKRFGENMPSCNFCGKDECMFCSFTKITGSVLELTNEEAELLYKNLLSDYERVKNNNKVVENILGTGKMMSDAQRKKIIRICRYKFNWSIEVTFSKLLEFIPDLRKKLTQWEIEKYKMVALYGKINKQQAGKIIKILEKIEKNNKQNEKK
ncbi:MAG TPA: hypothetical protein PLG90_13395 [Ignavibacteria bacterium]|nr:hypothetical protein [Ignavibacteria bacterium]